VIRKLGFIDKLINPGLTGKMGNVRATFRRKSAVVAALLLITALGVAFWMLRRSQEKLISAAETIPFKSIAVLPFENRSEDKAARIFRSDSQSAHG
jgi:hypothetical protein